MERLVVRLTIATETRSGEVPVRGWNIATSLFGHTSLTGGQVNNNNIFELVSMFVDLNGRVKYVFNTYLMQLHFLFNTPLIKFMV